MLNAIACELQEARRIIAHLIATEDFAKLVTLVSFAVSLTPMAYGVALLSGGR